MTRDIHEQLTKYLADAHAIEEQALAQLRTAPELAGDPAIAASFREHLTETEGHERLTRELLEARDAKPSRVKDAVMWTGGKGFLLFARLQPDTPGKLLTHAISYEALELASYSLLGDVASRAGETEVGQAATRIAGGERAMIERLEDHYDAAVDASLRKVGSDDVREQLRKYLADAHALEQQAIALLERAPEIGGEAGLGALYEEHLAETREHSELVELRLNALGGDPSSLKDSALRLGALNWAAFFQGHPDTVGKLAAFTFAFEHLEAAAYEQLRRVAERAGDQETASVAATILGEERAAAVRVAASFPLAAAASLDVLDVQSR
jgi:ferritin-like metal-binding protein YciE